MEENTPKRPPKENTKDDSSDVEKVRKDKQMPPPEPKPENEGQQSEQEREAEKGHA